MPRIRLKPRSLGLSRLSVEGMSCRERELLEESCKAAREFMFTPLFTKGCFCPVDRAE